MDWQTPLNPKPDFFQVHEQVLRGDGGRGRGGSVFGLTGQLCRTKKHANARMSNICMRMLGLLTLIIGLNWLINALQLLLMLFSVNEWPYRFIISHSLSLNNQLMALNNQFMALTANS